MNVNFEAIEEAWFKPKNKILFTKEELELLEYVFSLAIGECPSEDIKKINELEQKIKIYSGAWFKPKKNVLDELEEWLNLYYESNRKWYNYELSNHDRRYYEREYINTEFMIVKFLKQIQELKKEI